MHQPLLIAHKEGMGNSHSEIVHRLATLNDLDPTYRLDLAIELGHTVAKAEVLGIDPAKIYSIEVIVFVLKA